MIIKSLSLILTLETQLYMRGLGEVKKIVLYRKKDHYNVIVTGKLPAFHGKRFYCQKCKAYFHDYFSHPFSH